MDQNWSVASCSQTGPCDCLLISVAFVFLCCVVCLWVTGVVITPQVGDFFAPGKVYLVNTLTDAKRINSLKWAWWLDQVYLYVKMHDQNKELRRRCFAVSKKKGINGFSAYIPAGIWCENDVVLTSMRRTNVASTLIRRHFGTKCPLG